MLIVSHSWIQVCCRSGVGLTKAQFLDFSVREILYLAKLPVMFLESLSYLTGVTTDELRRHLLNMKSNRKYAPFPYCPVVVCLRCLLHHILSLIAYTFRENREFVFIVIVQFMMGANGRIRFALQIVLVCLYSTPSHYHHCSKLFEDIEHIKCLSDIFCRVWLRLSIFSQLSIIQSIIQYVGLCVCSLPTPLVMIERI